MRIRRVIAVVGVCGAVIATAISATSAASARTSDAATARALLPRVATPPTTPPTPTPVLTSVSEKTCLSWTYTPGLPWNCRRWLTQPAKLGISDADVYQPVGQEWRLIPYVYNSRTNVATYDYRRDTALRRPAFSSAGSAQSYYFTPANPKARPVKNPQLHWRPCNVFIGYSIDYRGIAGTKLNKDVEAARWRKAFSMITAAVPWQRFRDLSTSGTVYRPSASAKAFADQQIHITYATKKPGPYHWNVNTGELGYGGLNWSLNRDRSFNRIEWGFIIVDATKASNMYVWPSPHRSAGVDELLTLYVHEIGHALGLQHTSDKYQVMFPDLIPQKPNTLGAGDKTALRKLFPATPCPTRAAG